MDKPLPLCRSFDPELWFPVNDYGPPSKIDTAKATQICYECPLREPCLDYAMVRSIDYGVWGGLTAPERRRSRLTYFSRRRANDRTRPDLVSALASEA